MKACLKLFLIAITACLCYGSVNPANIHTVHLIFSNHFDAGFGGIDPTPGLARNVIDKYFQEYFPKAVQTANLMRQAGRDRYIWMTQSWLVSLYLDCPTGMGFRCPSEQDKQAVIKAIHQGDITWHAFPFNGQLEYMDDTLVEYGMEMTHELDKRFGRNATATISQRDVPGTTRAAVPLFAKHGVKAISFGVNAFSSPPQVPPAFVWRDPDSKTEVLGLMHSGGYGGIAVKDALMVDGLDHALVMVWNDDNFGPQSVKDVINIYDFVRFQFPNAANVFASTFDQFVEKLEPLRATLPVVEDEVGDTWIHGVASDPWKTAAFRAISRLRASCVRASTQPSTHRKLPAHCDVAVTSPEFKNFSRLLLKGGEHTWGGDVKTFLGAWPLNNRTDAPYFKWSNSQLRSSAREPEVLRMVDSWHEQRQWAIEAPVQALPPSSAFRTAIEKELAQLKPARPDISGFNAVSSFDFACGRYLITFDNTTGGIVELADSKSGLSWASKEHQIFSLDYQTFSEKDFETMMAQYGLCDAQKDCSWALMDFGKWKVSSAKAERQNATAALRKIYHKKGSDRDEFWLSYSLPQHFSEKYGAPESIWQHVQVEHFGNIQMTLHLLNKTASRLPEALWLRFNPKPQKDSTWLLNKLGSYINPFPVVVNGSSHLHNVQHSIRHWTSSKLGIELETKDSGLICLGEPNPFPTPLNTKPNLDDGASISLFNNIWGTNYVMWYPFDNKDGDAAYRFTLRILDKLE